jgi:quercetin dioxygenase-like cupin family protein
VRFLFVLLALLLSLSGASALAADTAPTIVAPGQIQWTPGSGPLTGSQVANLYGAPDKSGPFVTRIRMPDGLKFGPHWHPVLENVTVLQGTLMVGVGDKMDPAKMVALPAGSFVAIPANVHHYAMAKGDTIIQLNDVGPWAMNAVK